ncbi:MAG: protein kinase [Polyangiaceae bacterium]|nr:protein kinase [Polyangiaceae bacterium]
MRPQVGQVIHNKYRLLRLIGDGGMGSVFEARHEVLGTTVALKFLHPELSRRSGLVQRFLQEARVSAQIQSPHVVRVTDVDQNESGQAFIVMEYLEGKTLQTLYEELYHARQRLSYNDALEYAMQMLEGVEAAHHAGVVHRDLKPDNVIITRGKRGEPILKLLDFGIAKLKVTGQLDRGLTRPGIIMGTPEYMAPEQAYSADAVDARADIFSLGVMIFEMLAGRRPVGGDEPHQIATAYLTRNIAKLLDLAPHVPSELAAAIHRAMGPKPEDRWSSVAEFRSAIESFWLATRPAATPIPAGVSVVTPVPAQASPVVGASPVEGVRRVPKTLPPEDEAPAPAVSPAPGNGSSGMSVEVVFSDRPGQPTPSAEQVSSAPATTPVSKAPEPVGPTPQPAEPPSVVVADRGDRPVAAFAAFAATDATVEAPPIARAGTGTAAMPMVAEQASTVETPPLQIAGNNGTADMAPFERAGGTAIGASPMFAGSGGTEAAPVYTPAAGMPATASMDPTPFAPPPTAKAPRRAARSTGASFALIIIAAAAVAGAVVGGVYLAQQRARQEDAHDDPPAQIEPPPATVAGDPPTPSTGVRPVPVPTPAPIPRPLPKPSVTATGPAPTTQPTTQPSTQPTTLPTTFPTSLPTTLPTIPTSLIPIPLPTVLPFPFPGTQPQQQPGRPGNDPNPIPTLNKPQPNPSSTSTGTKKPQIVIKFPKNQD